jgi:hypothetical protein
MRIGLLADRQVLRRPLLLYKSYTFLRKKGMEAPTSQVIG